MFVANLRWRRHTTTEDGFRVYRSMNAITPENAGEPIATLPPGTTTYADTGPGGEGLEYDAQYYYVISVIKGDVENFGLNIPFSRNTIKFGPGPNVLLGNNDTAGFFGEVPASELITGNALATLVGLTTGTAQNSDVPWLKYFLDDKILYIPTKPHRHSISWDMLNAANVVFGNKIVEIQGYQFKVRLLKGLNPDTPNTVSNGYDILETHFSEWNRLIYPTVIDNPIYPQTSQIGPDWASYTETELVIINTGGNGSYTWCQETNALDATRRVHRGFTASSYFNTRASSDSNANRGWRACLELIA